MGRGVFVFSTAAFQAAFRTSVMSPAGWKPAVRESEARLGGARKFCGEVCRGAPRAVVARRRRHEAFETRRGTSRFRADGARPIAPVSSRLFRSNPGDPPRQCRSRARLAPCLRSRTTRRVEPILNGDLGFPLSSRAAELHVATLLRIAFNRISCAKWLLVPLASLQEMSAVYALSNPVG